MNNENSGNALMKKRKALSKFAITTELNLPARSSVYYTFINLLSKGAALIFTPVFTRILTPMEYGEYSLFSSYLSLALVIGSLELSGGVVMRAFQKYRRRTHITILISSLLTLVVTTVTVFVFWCIKLVTGGGMSFPNAYIFLFFTAASSSVINLYLSRCRYLYKWIPTLIATLIQSIAAPVCSIIIISISATKDINHISTKIGTLTFFLCAAALCFTIISIIQAKREKLRENLTRAGIIAYSHDCLKLLLRLCLPMLPYYFAVIVISQADKILISEFLGKDSLGKYSVAYSAGIALVAVTSGICSTLCPWIMRKVRSGEFHRIKRVLDTVISICIGIIICFLSLAPDIFAILAPAEYQSALPVIFIASLIPIPLALAQCMSSVAIAKERVLGVFICGAIPAALAVTLGFIFIPGGSLLVPALITALSYILLAVLGIGNTSRLLGKAIIDVPKGIQKLLLLAALISALFVFRDFVAVRICAALISLLFLIYMAKASLALVKETRSSI